MSTAAVVDDSESTEISVGGRSAWVLRLMQRGRRSENFYVLGNPPGRPKFVRSTGFSTKGEAIARARLLWRAELNRHMEGVAAALDGAKLRRAVVMATIGEILAAHECAEKAGRLGVKPRVAAGYRHALVRVVAWAHGLLEQADGDDARRWPDEAAVARLPASVLTEDLVAEFEARYVASAGGDYLARDRRRRGVEALLRNARAMLGDLRIYRGLELPKLKGFLEAKIRRGPKVRHEDLSDAAVAEMAAAAQELREQEPALYLVHLLHRHLGMRNDEIVNARREWVERLARPETVELASVKREVVTLADGSRREICAPETRLVPAVMAIERRSYWVPKQSTGRVPIAPCVLAELERWLVGDALEHLVPAPTPTARWELVYLRHADFVRPWTAHLAKRGYELRRWAATRVRLMMRSREAGDLFLRHAGKSVAEAHYFTRSPLPPPITLADCTGAAVEARG